MPLFWILATLMTAAAAAFVLVPLLRSRAAQAPSQEAANLEVLRSQRREIDADVAAGTLPAEDREQAVAELVERAAQDLEAHETAAPAERRPWPLAIAAGVLIPALAFGLYAALGTPQGTDRAAVASEQRPDEAQIVAMVENLARKVRERPDDAQGWALLARSMAALGRFKESADAYQHLAALAPNDPQVLADYADALGMAQGRTLAGKPAELARQALKLDPAHRKALALVGTAALDEGDYAGAVGYWEKLATVLPPGSPDAPQVQEVIDEIRKRAAAAGKSLPAAKAAGPTPTPGPSPKAEGSVAGSNVAGSAISGTVSVAPEIAARVSGGETLFVYARAAEGPRMPLAIIRTTARDLPLKFTLDDSQAMSPMAKLSGAAQVRVEARLSKSGNAMAQAGDLVGTSAVVQPGARDLRIVIDKVQP